MLTYDIISDDITCPTLEEVQEWAENNIKNDNQKQSDTEGDLCEPVRDVLDEGSKLD